MTKKASPSTAKAGTSPSRQPAVDSQEVIIDETATLDDDEATTDDAPEGDSPAEDAPEPKPARVKGVDIPLRVRKPRETAEEQLPVPGKGEALVEYRGFATLLRFEEYRFRPGQPVIVRSDVVEELLTMPNEKFVVVKE